MSRLVGITAPFDPDIQKYEHISEDWYMLPFSSKEGVLIHKHPPIYSEGTMHKYYAAFDGCCLMCNKRAPERVLIFYNLMWQSG